LLQSLASTGQCMIVLHPALSTSIYCEYSFTSAWGKKVSSFGGAESTRIAVYWKNKMCTEIAGSKPFIISEGLLDHVDDLEVHNELNLPDEDVDVDNEPHRFVRKTSDGYMANPLAHATCSSENSHCSDDEKNEPGSGADITRMRDWLEAEGWAEAKDFFSDIYLKATLSGHKDGKLRTFQYTAEKLAASLRWRREYGADSIAKEQVARALAPNHMWWEGTDLAGRPILYVRPALMDLSTYNREEYLKAHVYLIEEGIRNMPQGVASFVLIADASSLNRHHFDPALMKGLLSVLSVGYPDRLHKLVVGPINFVVRAAWALLSRLMPKRLANKVLMVKSPRDYVHQFITPEAPSWLP